MFRSRVIIVLCMLGIPMSAIVWRLFDIQVLHADVYAAASKKQAQQRILLTAKRGEIRDRKGRVMSANIGSQVKLPATMVAALSDSADTIRGSVTLRRMYPFGEVAGSVLGYVGKDGDGLGGAEFYYNKYLNGVNGWEVVLKDARNKRYYGMNLPKKDPVNGCDVYLTIDVDIQKIAENVIRQAVTALSAKGGMCIVMEPSTGKILAMVNEPSFNPNMPARYSLEQRLNKCIGYTYEPGSTFKILTSACALQERVKKENDTIDGNQGVYEVFNEKIKDEKKYGKLSFTEALCYSSNVCFAKIANEIGNERLYKYTRDFGLGDRTGIELPGEENGIVHPVEKWSGRTRVTMAIGQEVLATPLQMVMLFAAVANNGVLCQPRICDRIVSTDGAIVDSSVFKPVRRVISADVATRLKKMMNAVVEKGTGVRAKVPGLAICGKTGTGQKVDKESGTYSNTRGWSSFIGFMPAENPQLLCAVIIDEPLHGEMGGAAAAPAFSKIVGQLIAHPQLEYAERMLPHSQSSTVVSVKQDSGLLEMPQICGMKAVAATAFLEQENIPYEISGVGSIIEYQSPAAGNFLYAGTKLLLYTNSPDSVQKKEYGLVMPQCKGKDLRDAVNSVNMRGLVPYIVGAGTVRRQWPQYGTLMKQAEACTLICSFAN